MSHCGRLLIRRMKSKLPKINASSIMRIYLILQFFSTFTSAVNRGQVTHSFYETLGENERDDRKTLLRSMIYDYENSIIYVGAVNRVYALSHDHLENVSDSYKSSMDYRPQDCLNSETCEIDLHDYIQLLVPHKNILMVCGTARKGQCVRLFSNPLKETTNPVGFQLVSMDRFLPSFAFFGSNKTTRNNLIVATSYKPPSDAEKLINKVNITSQAQFHFIRNSEGSNHPKHMTFGLSPNSKHSVSMEFKGGFNYNGATYFFSNQTGRGDLASSSGFITRICDNDPETFVEFRLVCKGNNDNTNDESLLNEEFNELQQVKFLSPSVDQSDNGDSYLRSNHGLLFALFRRKNEKKNDSSALCIYNMSDVERYVHDVINYAINHKRNSSDVYRFSEQASKGPVTLKDVEANKCTKLNQLSPISSSSHSLSPNVIISLGREPITALAVRKDDNIIMTYLGINDGKIFKMKINSSPQPMVELNIGYQPYAIKDLIILQKDKLFALTKKEILKIKTFDCLKITTCHKCVADNHCGWCMSSNRCIDSASSCPISQHYISDACISHSIVGPDRVAFQDTYFKVNVSRLPSAYDKVACRYVDLLGRSHGYESPPTLVSRLGDVTCPLKKNNLKLDASRSVIPIQLSLIFDNTTWTSSSLMFINCESANSCQECTNISCIWNPHTLGCSNKTPSSSSSSFISSQDGCPHIMATTRLKIPAGSDEVVSLLVRNLPDIYKAMKCSFEGSMKISQNDTSASNARTGSNMNNVTCPKVQLDYQEGISSKKASLNLMTSNMKTLISESIQVYKCRYLALNCGQCQSLDISYGCVWCNDACEHVYNCKSLMSSIDRQDVCKDVAISTIHPPGGPINGNTLITVTGKNFGLKESNIIITIDKVRCTDVKIENMERLTCRSSKGHAKSPLNLTIVSLKPSVSARSLEMFHFKDPFVTKMEPTKGLMSGGTTITLTGHHLDYGNEVFIYDGSQQLPIISRNSKEIVFQTLPVIQRMSVTFDLSVDNSTFTLSNHPYQYLEDPIIETFEHPFTISHGGTPVIFKGKNFNNLNSAWLIVYLNDGTNRTGQLCNIDKDQRMACLTPDINDVFKNATKVKVHFGILGCSVKRWSQLSRPDVNHTMTPMKLLTYYRMFDVFNLPEIFKIKEETSTPQFVDVRSSNDDLLRRLKDSLTLWVGGHKVESSPNNPLRFQLPHYFELEDSGKHHDIMVKVGNYKKTFGRVSLVAKTNLARLVGWIVGLSLGFVSVIVVAYFVYRCCKLKHKSKHSTNNNSNMDNCNVSIPNLREVSSRGDHKAINPYSMRVPGSAHEMVPLVRSTSEDENYFQNIIKAIDVLPQEGTDVYISRDKLQLGNLIGRGNFGSVFIATMLGSGESEKTTVAVKTIDDLDMKEKAVENFVKEGLMMKKFNHPNVMSLHGLCVGYRKEPMVVLPYMTNGDLRTYIKETSKQFTARQLLQLTHQVSQGMAYLSSLNFIHRDLAARNCMIDEHEVVKVADFGLSHELHEKNYYSSRDQKAKLPIKWMALESLESFIFTVKSDVWSFGVLMWEVMTRGVTPYPDVEIFETRDYLASGRRLRKPKYCPDNVYEIMLKCWSEYPDHRPSFVDLVHDLEIILNPPKRISNPEFNYLNQHDLGSSNEVYLRPL